MERASIDELFIDVTDHCHNESKPVWERLSLQGKNDESSSSFWTVSDLLVQEVMKETVICAQKSVELNQLKDKNFRALRRGCVIARGLRKVVFDTLGFTLSAGISSTKNVAKLAASYGKPDGQAVIFQSAIPEVRMIILKTLIRFFCAHQYCYKVIIS